MLQGWQAYQALTYESQWKPFIDEEWDRYTKEWVSKHPNEKPPKTRFELMIEFVKEKYENETEEMKERCEEFRKTLKEESVVADSERSARNMEFQVYVSTAVPQKRDAYILRTKFNRQNSPHTDKHRGVDCKPNWMACHYPRRRTDS